MSAGRPRERPGQALFRGSARNGLPITPPWRHTSPAEPSTRCGPAPATVPTGDPTRRPLGTHLAGAAHTRTRSPQHHSPTPRPAEPVDTPHPVRPTDV